jgi:hypothetical protein
MASSNRYFQSRNLLFVFNIIAYMVPGEIMPLGGYQGFLKCRFAAKFIARGALKGRTVDGDESVVWDKLPLKCSL